MENEQSKEAISREIREILSSLSLSEEAFEQINQDIGQKIENLEATIREEERKKAQQKIDSEMQALKDRVDKELAEHKRSLEIATQSNIKGKICLKELSVAKEHHPHLWLPYLLTMYSAAKEEGMSQDYFDRNFINQIKRLNDTDDENKTGYALFKKIASLVEKDMNIYTAEALFKYCLRLAEKKTPDESSEKESIQDVLKGKYFSEKTIQKAQKQLDEEIKSSKQFVKELYKNPRAEMLINNRELMYDGSWETYLADLNKEAPEKNIPIDAKEEDITTIISIQRFEQANYRNILDIPEKD